MKTRLSSVAVRRAYSCRASISDLEPEFKSMVDKAIQAIVAYEPNPDRIFGKYSELASVARSVAFHEGKLLEWGIAAIAKCNPDLVILPPDRPMPIVPAAIQLLKKNEWREIQGIRLPSEVHANRTYTPDLFIANRARHAGLIIDVKRSLGSYAESKLEDLRFRMLAVAAIASSWLSERQGPILVEVGTAIIDGADISSDHEKGVFKLSEIGDLLEVDEAGDAMTRLRDMFAARVQQELESQCRKVIGTAKPVSRQSMSSVDFSRDEAEDALLDAGSTGISTARSRSHQSRMPSLSTNVRVGFARFRSGS
ncbi:hypothetical protein [Nitrobacter vulgaris]|uniref:Uncharacterized protein n=1 Tax=Nitrobacter vulgaris TaxID=29421 RepID=A0A1V4HYV4_NITVU|nr:hypothetical protein [Nitrobacter vulgaris]OPH83123.1 hypothetical protein B2M20_09085 [Nitrobacter vulgaris]